MPHGEHKAVALDRLCGMTKHSVQGGGGFTRIFSSKKIRRGFISHAVPNLLWEIGHPHAMSMPLARVDLSYCNAFWLVSA